MYGCAVLGVLCELAKPSAKKRWRTTVPSLIALTFALVSGTHCCLAAGSTVERARDDNGQHDSSFDVPHAVGWWTGALDALDLLSQDDDRLFPCVAEDGGGSAVRVCPAVVTDAFGRTLGRGVNENGEACLGPRQTQAYTTLEGGRRVVPALVRWYDRGDPCESSPSGTGSATEDGDDERGVGRRRSSRRVLFLCDEGGAGDGSTSPKVLWSGEERDARLAASRSSWMRLNGDSGIISGSSAKLAVTPPLACDGEIHVSAPVICGMLYFPDWLKRFDELIDRYRPEADGGHDSAFLRDNGEGSLAGDRERELQETRNLIEDGWRRDRERGLLAESEHVELLRGLRLEMDAALSGPDSERPRTERIGANYDFTYGELSTEGGLQIADELFLYTGDDPRRAVVYDLGSGYGRTTILLAMYGVSKSVGIELDASRQRASLRLLNFGVNHELITEEESKRIELRHGDAFGTGAFTDATHVYMLSTCFGPHIFARFLNSISPETHPALRWICSSRKIPEDLLQAHNGGKEVRCKDVACNSAAFDDAENNGIQKVVLKNTVTVPTTFSASCRLYLYRVESYLLSGESFTAFGSG